MSTLLETPGVTGKGSGKVGDPAGGGREPSAVRCPKCALEFHPAYTEGCCPLCGEAVPGETETPRLPFWASITQWAISGDRAQWAAIGLFAAVSLVMLIITILAYLHV
ncbi:MAG: hypothetical protein WDA71_11410 [Actinomycetota bacterium]